MSALLDTQPVHDEPVPRTRPEVPRRRRPVADLDPFDAIGPDLTRHEPRDSSDVRSRPSASSCAAWRARWDIPCSSAICAT